MTPLAIFNLHINAPHIIYEQLSACNELHQPFLSTVFLVDFIHFASAAVAVDSTQMIASASWSRFNPPSNFVSGSWSPQSQEGDWVRPHLCKFARHGPWPVRKRFSRDHVWQGRSKPGCQIVGSVTIVWLTREADDQSSLHCVIVSTDVMSDHIGHRDASHRGGCSETSAYTGQFGWASMIWSILSVAALRRREGGATLLSTGSHESCMGCRQPEIRDWIMTLGVDEICVAGSSPHWMNCSILQRLMCGWLIKQWFSTIAAEGRNQQGHQWYQTRHQHNKISCRYNGTLHKRDEFTESSGFLRDHWSASDLCYFHPVT